MGVLFQFSGLKASPVAWTSFFGGLDKSKTQFLIEKMLHFFSCKFFKFLVIKTLYRYLILDPDPER